MSPSKPLWLLLAALSWVHVALCAGTEGPNTPSSVLEGNALPPTNTPVSDITFVLFDVQTTGYNFAQDRLLKIAAIKFCGGKILQEKQWLTNPGRLGSTNAHIFHPVTEEAMRDRPDFKTIYPEFEQFICGTVMMAHNANFDMSFIREECLRNELHPPANPVLNTLPLFRKWFPQCKRHNLDDLSRDLKIASEERPYPMSDTMKAVLIFQKGLKQLPANYTFGELLHDAHHLLWFTEY